MTNLQELQQKQHEITEQIKERRKDCTEELLLPAETDIKQVIVGVNGLACLQIKTISRLSVSGTVEGDKSRPYKLQQKFEELSLVTLAKIADYLKTTGSN